MDASNAPYAVKLSLRTLPWWYIREPTLVKNHISAMSVKKASMLKVIYSDIWELYTMQLSALKWSKHNPLVILKNMAYCLFVMFVFYWFIHFLYLIFSSFEKQNINDENWKCWTHEMKIWLRGHLRKKLLT